MTMTNSVISLTHSVDKLLIKKLFTKFSVFYGSIWTNRLKTNSTDDWEECCNIWFEELKNFDRVVFINAAKESFLKYKDFPPTLGQLIELCLKFSGVPSQDEIINLLINRDFKHPLVKMVYDRIDTWLLSTGKTDEIKLKINDVYISCLKNFKENPEEAKKQLEVYKSQPVLPVPSKTLTNEEKSNVREIMKLATAQPVQTEKKIHPEWPIAKITIGHRNFDSKVFNERRQYLINMDEVTARTLPIPDRYDRIRFLREIEGSRGLDLNEQIDRQRVDTKNQSRGYNSTVQVFKDWYKD